MNTISRMVIAYIFPNLMLEKLAIFYPDQNNTNQEIKNNINKSDGYLITVIDLFSFSIDYDSSNIQNPLPDTSPTQSSDLFTFEVFYGSKRIFLPIELTYIMPEPGHISN